MKCRTLRIVLGAIIILIMLLSYTFSSSQIPVSAPVFTDSAGAVEKVAIDSVFRIICPQSRGGGTGFLHTSGGILTAAHVIEGATTDGIVIITAGKKAIRVIRLEKDVEDDIAILWPKEKILASSFTLSGKSVSDLKTGSLVSTWGYPSGYNGANPMLSVGWLSGVDLTLSASRKPIRRLVVNAAFNGGNSGGPLIDIESGEVIGIVASKLAPIPPDIENALKVLKSTPYGMKYTRTFPDGKTIEMSEAQVLEEVLQYLRSQTQLVVGQAIPAESICDFLKRISQKQDNATPKRK